MELIDTHVHLYEGVFQEDLALIIEKASTNGIQKLLMPNVDKNSIMSMKNIAALYSQCLPMMGLHPCYVKEDYQSQLDFLSKELNNSSYVGIGEIGLDLYWDKSFYKEQEDAFITQCNWAIDLHLPVSIHSREATRQAIDLLQPLKGRLNGVFHCFVGTVEEGLEIIDLGFYLGIGGVVTFKNGGLDKVLPRLPLDKIVLETDAPYLAPIPFRGKRNESSYITYIAKKVAEIYQLPFEEVAKRTTYNAKALFNI